MNCDLQIALLEVFCSAGVDTWENGHRVSRSDGSCVERWAFVPVTGEGAPRIPAEKTTYDLEAAITSQDDLG